MDQQEWIRIKTIVAGALSEEPSRRQEYVRKTCGDDKHLLIEVEEQLRCIMESEEEGFLNKLEIDQREFVQDLGRKWTEAEGPTGLIGQQIGPYEITALLGSGGMGAVYKAIRVDGAFHHTVAIKLIGSDVESEETITRFKRERQILASLKHPNIAQLYDGGITSDGVPYLIMEFVDGTHLTSYCKQSNLDLDGRLDLFLEICDAVMYAHRNLVVHRDLKPSNILVTEGGGIKLLDFGIAKLLENPSYPTPSDGGQNTNAPTTRLMTPWYASPEQISGKKITTSADIYTLGVIFYELMTGTLPFDFEGKSPSQIEHIINAEEPKKPTEAAAGRAMSFRIGKDLDLICLKALRKETERRYGSVQELKEDLLRFLNGFPIQARPASVRYRIGRFITRNRALLGAASLFMLAAAAFGSYHVFQITEQRNIAQLEAEKATRVKNFTTNLFYANNPYHRGNIDEGVTLKQLLETGIQNIEGELSDDPEIYAEMYHVIGHALLGLGEYEKAKTSLEKSIQKNIELYGENYSSVASTMSLLGRLEGIRGNRDTALTVLGRALKINKTLYGEPSSEVAVNIAEIARVYTLWRDYERATKYFNQSLEMHEKLGEEHELDYNLTLSELVNVQIRQGLLEEAEKNQLRAIENLNEIHGNNHLNMANSYLRLAEIQYRNSNLPKSEAYAQKALELQKTLSTPDNPDMIDTFNFLGQLYQRLGKYEESEEHLREAIRIFTENALTDSLKFSSYLNNLALTKSSMGQPEEAAELHRDVLDIRNRLLPPDHSAITLAMYNLAHDYYKMNDLDRARILFGQVVERDKHSLGEDHREVAVDLVKLGAVTIDLSEYERAEQIFSEAELIFADKFPAAHYRTGEFYMEYGRLKMMKGEHKSAATLLEKSLSIFQENYSDDHEKIVTVQKYLSALSIQTK